jgi:hypothetical protein
VKVAVQLLMLDALRKGALGGTLCRCGGPKGLPFAFTQRGQVIICKDGYSAECGPHI